MSIKLIVALDFDNQHSALTLVDQLNPADCALKVGSEMFTLFGTNFVRELVARGFKVFLDLKYHDIPNTVARACKASADLGVWMINVHASGGLVMMQAAREALDSYGSERPLLIAVTVLTSMGMPELKALGIKRPLQDHVTQLAQLAQIAALDGVVCSGQEVSMIKDACGHDFLTITPGIRLSNDAHDDQTRTYTPEQALSAGSNYLVIGRPITRAVNPIEVVHNLLLTLNK